MPSTNRNNLLVLIFLSSIGLSSLIFYSSLLCFFCLLSLILISTIDRELNESIIQSFLFRIMVLLGLTILAFKLGRLDMIGDSYVLHWFTADATKSLLILDSSKTFYRLYGFRLEHFQFYQYGMSFYFFLIALLKTAFLSINIDLKFLNIMISLIGAPFLYKIVAGIASKEVAKTSLWLYLFYPLLMLWSVFLLKDPMQSTLIILIFWTIITLKNKPFLKTGIFLGLVLLLSLNRFKMVGLYSVFFVSVFFYYHLSYKKSVLLTFLVFSVGGTKILQVIQTGFKEMVSFNYGHFSTGGYCFQLLDPFYYKTRMLPPDLNYFYLAFKGFYNALVQPNPWYFYNLNYGVYQLIHITWFFLVLMALIGFMYLLLTGKLNKGFQIIAFYILIFGIILGISDGNIGTLIRHRSMIEPFVFIFSAVGIYVCFPLKRLMLEVNLRANNKSTCGIIN